MTRAPLAGHRLLVRADATAASGTGHLMRCLALAQAWVDLGGTVRWLLVEAPGPLVARLRTEGIAVDWATVLAGSPADGDRVGAALREDPATVGVVDGYGFGDAFMTALGSEARRVLLVDDMAALAAYPMGWVLNQNAHADRASYPPDARARFLLGPRYILLRREFRAAPAMRPVPPRASRLLVTFGGADPTGMTLRTLRAMRMLPPEVAADLQVRLIVGAANPDAESIVREAAVRGAGPGVEVRQAVADMPAEIGWADLALTSGGSTVWELARYGCPALVVETVPAETRLVAGLRRLGLFDALGPETRLDDGKIAKAVTTRIADAAWRRAMRDMGMHLVDGGGARRVALALAARDEEGQT